MLWFFCVVSTQGQLTHTSFTTCNSVSLLLSPLMKLSLYFVFSTHQSISTVINFEIVKLCHTPFHDPLFSNTPFNHLEMNIYHQKQIQKSGRWRIKMKVQKNQREMGKWSFVEMWYAFNVVTLNKTKFAQISELRVDAWYQTVFLIPTANNIVVVL